MTCGLGEGGDGDADRGESREQSECHVPFVADHYIILQQCPLLPLAGPSMYASLGLGWGNSILGFIAIALIPAPGFIYKFGGRIRKEHPIKL